MLKFCHPDARVGGRLGFSTLQRVEIAEIHILPQPATVVKRFSTLQRVEIAEIINVAHAEDDWVEVSVLFNESKLLKSLSSPSATLLLTSFSTLQRVEIAEIGGLFAPLPDALEFQYSSTSRNC